MKAKTRWYAILNLTLVLALVFMPAAQVTAAPRAAALPVGSIQPQAQEPALPLPGLLKGLKLTPPGPEPRQPAGPQSLSGSFVAFDPEAGGANGFLPGETQTLCFRAESFTTDWEYLHNVWLKFPTDWAVSEVQLAGTPTCDSGSVWSDLLWSYETSPYEIKIDHQAYQEPTDHCVATYCVDVTAGASPADPTPVSWYYAGDAYGEPPHHPCSSDAYTPPSMGSEPCDQANEPPAEVPLLTIPLFVDEDAEGANTGLSWADAFTDLQEALYAAESGTRIWVAEGTYKPTGGTDREMSFELPEGVKLYGGFAGTETRLMERDWRLHPTILSGDIGLEGDPTDNSYVVVKASGATKPRILDGFTLTGGYNDSIIPYGAGIYAEDVTGTFRNLTVRQNYATGGGAGMLLIFGSQVDILDSQFLENTVVAPDGAADTGGAGLLATISELNIANTVFASNEVQASNPYGGAIWLYVGQAILTNVTAYDNHALGTGGFGGGISTLDADLALTNSIFFGNTAVTGSQVYTDPDSSMVTLYSLVDQEPCPGVCDHVLTGDPLFVDGAAGDLRLQPFSQAVDAGSNPFTEAAGLVHDLEGQARFVNHPFTPDSGVSTLLNPEIVDLGAYETLAGVIYVDQDALGENTGMSWADAFTDLQDALLISGATTQVWVADGTYKPTAGIEREISFVLNDGAALYGGFEGWETSLDQRDWRLHETILSGDIGTPDEPTDNSYNVVQTYKAASSTVLDGFTITGGYADAGEIREAGGGMLNQLGAPTLRNLIFSGNQAIIGGGMMNIASSPRLVDVVFSGNIALANGGGIFFLRGSSPSLVNVVFLDNYTGHFGGALVVVETPNLAITNATFWGNSAGEVGGAIANFYGNLLLQNSLLWGNTSLSNPQIYNDEGTTTGIANSLVEGSGGSGAAWDGGLGLDLGGNKDEDPLFVDTAAGDLHLQPFSPAVDAGDNSAPGLAGILFDLDGLPRFMDIVTTADTGMGTAPLVDMGAYETQPGLLPVLAAVKTAPANVNEGDGFDYILVIENSGLVDATGVSVSDPLPFELGFIGPVTVDPPQPGAVLGGPPDIAGNLVIEAGQTITLTIPVHALDGPATIPANTATITALELAGPVVASSSTVEVANLPPVAWAGGPYTLDEGAQLNLAASAYDPGLMDLLTLAWDFDLDGQYDDGTGPTALYTAGTTPGVYSIGLQACDDDGDCATDIAWVTVENLNETTAGFVHSPLPVEGAPVMFTDASTTATPDHLVSWEWEFGDGGTGAGQNPQYTYLDNGVYDLILGVTDEDGDYDDYAYSLTVANAVPVVDAGPDQSAVEGEAVAFAGSFTDPGMLDTHTYAWDFGDGSAPVMGSLTPQHTFAAPGVYVVSLTVTDNDGGVGTDSLVVTVGNLAPVVDAGPDQEAVEGEAVAFVGSFTDPSPLDTHTYEWDFGDGSAPVTGSLTPQHTFADNGVYTVNLTVTDSSEGIGTDSLVVTVGNLAPVVDAGPDQEAVEGEAVAFAGSFTDPGTLDTHSYEWDFGDSSAPVLGSLTPQHTFADNGVYTVTVTVTDDDGGVGTDSLTVTVANVAPTVDAGPDQDALVDEAVAFAGSFTDPGMLDTHSYTWDFGDGSPPVTGSLTTQHTFTAIGVYTVTLTVTDDDGGVGTDSAQVTVGQMEFPMYFPMVGWHGDQDYPQAVDKAGPHQLVKEGLRLE